MMTMRLLALALSICFCAACTSGNNREANSPTSPEDQVVPGVGAAPDSSDRVTDSAALLNDTTSIKRR